MSAFSGRHPAYLGIQLYKFEGSAYRIWERGWISGEIGRVPIHQIFIFYNFVTARDGKNQADGCPEISHSPCQETHVVVFENCNF